MRIAVVAESFLPQINGVTVSVLRVLEHLQERGHEALVLAPGAREEVPAVVAGAPVVPFGAVGLPRYPDVRVVLRGRRRMAEVLRDFAPDVVHLAAPFALGWCGALIAQRLGLPCVAVYQTEVPGYASRYGAARLEPVLTRRVQSIHRRATLTLAPSIPTVRRLQAWQVPRVRLWRHGVDPEAFHPRFRDEGWRRRAGAGPAEVLVGYVGRLAAEKRVERLAEVADLPGVRLVVVGDGPERDRLRARLPGARFTGQLLGAELATAMASLDVLLHPGELETFGLTLQEAHASGVPVVAPAAGGPLDVVHDGQDGWLYPPGDLVALRSRVADLAGDARRRRAFATAARARAEAHTWDRACAELVRHYEEAVAEQRRLPAPAPEAAFVLH